MGGISVGILIVVALTIGFEGLLFGQDIVTSSFPSLRHIDFGACGGGLDGIGCVLGNAFAMILNVFLFIIGLAVFVFNLVTFDAPGAPIVVRFALTTIVGLPLAWSIAMLVRGD